MFELRCFHRAKTERFCQVTLPLLSLRKRSPFYPDPKKWRGSFAMKVKRRIEIITVREQTYRSPQPGPFTAPPPSWCNGCQTATQLLSPDLAATISGLTLRTLFRWIESGHIHFVETPEGQVLICLPSLTANAIQVESEVVFSNGSCTSTNTTYRAG